MHNVYRIYFFRRRYRYDFTPCSRHVAAMSRRSSMVKWLAECDRMFSCSTPKYTESAPAFNAAANESRLPTGAIISKSFISIILERCDLASVNKLV